MYCVRCGAKAEEKRKTCAKCGMRLITPEALIRLLKKADEEKKKASPSLEKKKPTEKRTVVPIMENPTQPKRRSIFDEEPEEKKASTVVKVPEKKPKTVSKRKPEETEKKKRAEEARKANPVVKLPPRKTETKEAEIRSAKKGYSREMFLIPERRESTKRTSGIRRASGANASAKSAGKAKAASARKKTADDEKRHKRPTEARKAAPARKSVSVRGKRKKETFAEKHIRSIVCMCLLAVSVSIFLAWGFTSESGMKTFAQMGFGTTKGYILLGDECMGSGNYNRAVEYYYKALKNDTDYNAAWKLSVAYKETGDIERETSALLLLMDRYPKANVPYARILELYPDIRTRPERVQQAVSMYENAN